MTADLLREAARAVRDEWIGGGEPLGTAWHREQNFHVAVADLLDALALDREMDPYLSKPFDEPALTVARAYLGRDS